MRELKFRVWSEEDKEYRPDIKVSDLVIDIDGVPSTIYSNEGDRFDIEQYTGLKDVNGNEITEGDILEDGEGEPFEYWVVKFKDGKFVGETQGVTEDLFELTDLEIVGTIREHPEFLEEKE